MHIHKSQLPDLTLIDVIISRSLPVCVGLAGGSTGEEEEEEKAGERDFQLVRPTSMGSSWLGVAAMSAFPFTTAKVPITAWGQYRRKPCELGNASKLPPVQPTVLQTKLQE